MQILFERDFISYFVEFLDARERIAVRQTCRASRNSIVRQDGLTAKEVHLMPEYGSRPILRKFLVCSKCGLLFKSLFEHFEIFPSHNHETWIYHSLIDVAEGLPITKQEVREILSCRRIHIQTNYGYIEENDIRARGLCFSKKSRRFYIHLNRNPLYIIDSRLYLRIRLGVQQPKFAAIISINIEGLDFCEVDERFSKFAIFAGLS